MIRAFHAFQRWRWSRRMLRGIKRGVHFVLVGMLAPVFWLLGFAALAVALALVVAADKVWPRATMGNCWSFVGPRWWKYGGIIGVRASDGVTLFHRGPIPHAMWIKRLFPTVILEQSSPLGRKEGGWLLFRGGTYFRFRRTDVEKPHDAREAPKRFPPRPKDPPKPPEA